MRRLLSAFALFAIGASGAGAQSITLEADKVLWCGSAFYWLAVDASDGGEDAEADQYGAWSEQLMAKAVALLRLDQLSDAQITHIATAYDKAVLAELGTDKARHDVATCPELVAKD
jgi:hypothetical protein